MPSSQTKGGPAIDKKDGKRSALQKSGRLQGSEPDRQV